MEIVCICGGYGFPLGISSADRVRLLGKSFLSRGIPFRLLHCGTSPNSHNTESKGVYEGIRFEYTTPTVQRPNNRLVRALVYAWAYLVLTLRLFQLKFQRRRKPVVYLFFLGDLMQVYVGGVCRLLGIPVIQDVCEWWPGSPGRTRFTDWAYRSFLPWSASAAVAISRSIEMRLEAIAAHVRSPLRVVRVPVLLDTDQVALFSPSGRQGTRYVLWVGSLDAYPNDVDFCIRAVAAANRQGDDCRLVCAGFASDRARARVSEAVNAAGLPANAITVTGFVSEDTLRDLCASAAALLLPMWNDDRSITRYPHKIGDYLMAGRPVVTCAIGELAGLLEDNVSGCFYEPGDVEGCAHVLHQLLLDRPLADSIGSGGRDVARTKLDYRAYNHPLEVLAKEVVALT